MHHLREAMQYRQAPLPKRGIYPLKRLYNEIWLGEEVPGAKFHRCGLKMWIYSPKIAKIGIFGINLPKMGIPFKRLLQNLARRRESQVRTLMPNFTVVALKNMGLEPLKS